MENGSPEGEPDLFMQEVHELMMIDLARTDIETADLVRLFGILEEALADEPGLTKNARDMLKARSMLRIELDRRMAG